MPRGLVATIRDRLFTWGALTLGATLLYIGPFGEYPLHVERGIPLLLAATLLFLRVPFARGWRGLAVDVALIAATVFAVLHIVRRFAVIATSFGSLSVIDFASAAAGAVVVLEMARRTIGMSLPVIAGGFVAYAFWGQWLPGDLSHGGFSLERVARFIWLAQDGVWGVPVGVMAEFVSLFIIFGAMVERTGAGQALTWLAGLATRRLRSGPGQSAVLSSAMFGMVSGSGVADVATIGTVTIPVMVRTGYGAVFAAAIQALASIGAQIMPPMLGVSAFLMAELTNTPYIRIAAAAVIPAMLYYLAVGTAVHLETARLNLSRQSGSVSVRERASAARLIQCVLPLIVLVYLLAQQYSPARSVFFAIVTLTALTVFEHRRRPRALVGLLHDVCVSGVEATLALWAATAVVGIVMGMVALTGIGNKLSELVLSLAGGNLLATLLLAAIASIVLGTGLPTLPSYLLLAILVAPALIAQGVPLLVAHFFLFFFGVTSDLTPPTALAPFTAAGIARVDPWRTTWVVLRIGLPVFFIPFAIVYFPQLIIVSRVEETVVAFALAAVGTVLICTANCGFAGGPLRVPTRILLLLAGVACMVPRGWVQLVGLGTGLAIVANGSVGRRAARKIGLRH
ncbi:MAG: TRAP transporter fused permease subunit [Candidatus Rokubacteria bacterium]|nr:TRAP transporter fused permease subunit [Candidatus Rokubacteria bacterium]